MELFILGLAVGGVVGARGKGVMKAAAKGYLTLSDKARELSANVREDMRDAIEEARYERETEAALREEMAMRDQEDQGEDIVIVATEYEPHLDKIGTLPTEAGARASRAPRRNSTTQSSTGAKTATAKPRARRGASSEKQPATASRGRSRARKSEGQDRSGDEHGAESPESKD